MGMIIAFILLALFVVYMTVRHFELKRTIEQHEEVLLKLDTTLFPTNHGIWEYLPGMKGDEIDRLKVLENKLNEATEEGKKKRAAIEKFLDIEYVVKEVRTEGYKKKPDMALFGTMSYGPIGSGMGYPLPDEIKPIKKVSIKKKHNKK